MDQGFWSRFSDEWCIQDCGQVFQTQWRTQDYGQVFQIHDYGLVFWIPDSAQEFPKLHTSTCSTVFVADVLSKLPWNIGLALLLSMINCVCTQLERAEQARIQDVG